MPANSGSSIVNLVRALSAPVALEEETLIKLAQIFRRKMAGASFNGEDLHAELGIAQPKARPTREQAMLAVIPIHGVIAQHPQSMGTSCDEIGKQLDAALASDRIDGILLDVDSPGGTIGGVPELAARIYAARQVKPITAISNGLMASAAYWLASAADEIVVTPSGEVGSIGVYCLHEDWSKNLEQQGVQITAIKAGRFKTEGAPWEPLTADAAAVMQERVDEVYGWFVKAVATFRKDSVANVRDGYGEGRAVGAVQAVNAKLADRIGTFEDTVGRMAAKVDKVARKGPRADILRKRLDLTGDFN